MKKHSQKTVPFTQPESPASESMGRVATLIEEQVNSRLDDEDIELTEAAGHLSMATLLQQVYNGELTPKEATKFLSDLASRKTPNPIQRIEERQQIDLRITFADIIKENPTALAHTLEQARIRNDEVKTRLQLTGNMELSGGRLGDTDQRSASGRPLADLARSGSPPAENFPTQNSKLSSMDRTNSLELSSDSVTKARNQGYKEPSVFSDNEGYKEPVEVTDLRRGGDGSRRKIEWATALGRQRRLPPLPEQGAE